MSHAYRTVPEDTAGMPSGVPYIIANEAAERFSFYGMKSILYVFMTERLLNSNGELAPMSPEDGTSWYHTFVFAVYFLPVLGALLSDGLLGKYRTIFYLSLVYCLGHLALAIDTTRIGLAIGLALIAFGSGGIKPCVSANVGDQFGESNKHLIERVYSWFYFSINFGSAFATILIPTLLKVWGPHIAFGVPGIFMALATLFFWMGRNQFVHAPPTGLGFLREVATPQGARVVSRLIIVALFVLMFWALYDQHGSTWIEQAKHLDRSIPGYDYLPQFIRSRMDNELLPSHIQAANPFLILIMIPIFAYVIYPTVNRFYKLTSLRKITIGFLLTASSFAVVAQIQHLLDQGIQLHVGWQLIAYVLITSGEVMVSITGLEYFYSNSPKSMKSIAMSIWLLAVAFGNLFTAVFSKFMADLERSSFFWAFAGMMLVTAILFIAVVSQFRDNSTPETA